MTQQGTVCAGPGWRLDAQVYVVCTACCTARCVMLAAIANVTLVRIYLKLMRGWWGVLVDRLQA